MKSYDYDSRKGVEEISWDRFSGMVARLTEALASLDVCMVIGIARAGLFPATAISLALRRELYPVRITSRVDDVVQFDHPIWRVDVPATVSGQSIVVIDEIADTGETLALVATRALERGARKAVTVCLVAHTWANPQPDLTALKSDALVIFPWDRQILHNGVWQLHPEIQAAIDRRGSDSNPPS
jgi:uncharacterized protein